MFERSKEFRLQSPEAQRLIVQHPNGAYRLMKLYAKEWLKKVDASNSFSSRTSHLSSRLPTEEDFVGAQSALVRLQYVYRLNVSDMYNGDYLGYLGPRLEPQDAFELGRQAFIDGFLEQSRQWLDLAAEKMREEQSRWPGAQKDSQTLAWTLALWHSHVSISRRRRLVGAGRRVDPNSGDVTQLQKELSGEIITNYGHSVREWHANMSDLCSRDKQHRVADIRPYHVCRYKPSLYSPYLQYKEEILSQKPYASVFYDIVSDTEISAIKGFIEGKMVRGMVGQGKNSTKAGIRTSDLGWIHDNDIPVAAALSQKVKSITRLEVDQRAPDGPSSAEALQNPIEEPQLQYAGERIATFLIYLSDVEKGGHTVFLRSGISVAPLKGMVLFWYNYEPDMNEMQQLTFHAGCPVLYGHKWICNKWIWTYGNTFRRPCGMSPNATQLDIERLVQSRDTARCSTSCARNRVRQRG
ncbi:hypothetical protein BaRGS_00004083, partial [Batillaria attramentaria]